MILEQIDQDLKVAMLSRDELKVMVLRGLKSTLANERISKRTGLTEADVFVVLKRELKQRDEAAAGFEAGGAKDKAEKELQEKAIIQQYMPDMMSEIELIRIIEDVVIENEATSLQVGLIIGQVMQRTKGLADGNDVARLVKARLL
jgi:hypothetical protein